MEYTEKAIELTLTCMAAGLADEVILNATGLDQDHLDVLRADEQFQGMLAARTHEAAVQSIRTDQNWDSLEAKALVNLHKVIDRTHDPDLNLRVAVMANKAVRRTRDGPNALNPANGNATVKLKLTQVYTEKLKQGVNGQANGQVNGNGQSREAENTIERSAELTLDSVERLAPEEIYKYLHGSQDDSEGETDVEAKPKGFSFQDLLNAPAY